MKNRRLFWTTVLILAVIVTGVSIFPALATAPASPPGAGVARQQTDSLVYIRSYRVSVEIVDQIARTRIEQVFANEGGSNAEGTYVFPLPRGVTISDLVMRIDGQPYRAKILEKEEAQQVYTTIVQQMRDPALLEYIGTNAIQANIFPIPPGGERTLEIEYSQLLEVDQGLIHYVYPLRVDHVSHLPVGSLSIHVKVESNDPISTIYSPTHTIAIDRQGDQAFVVGYETSNTHESNDFSLYYGLASDEVNLNLLTYRESATDDGFFMALIAPPVKVETERVIPKDVIVVLDSSGSMEGEKWEQARAAAQFVLDNLNPEDRFNLLVFNTGIAPYATKVQPVSQAQDAEQWLETLFASGDTNIDGALSTALDMNDHEHPLIVLFLTDGLPTAGVTDLPTILGDVEARAAENVRFFTFGVGDDVNTFLLDELSQRHHGASAYVRPGEKVNEAVSTLYSKVSAPLLTDLSLEIDGAVVYDVYPPLDRLPDLFAGSQLIVTGRYRREADEVTLRLSGNLGDTTQTFTYADQTLRTNAGGDVLIPRLWATRRIGELLNQIRLQGETPELVDSIVRLSIRYGIITPYTSFIITEQDIFTQQDVAQSATLMAPTAQAMAANASGNSAVNAAQQAGGMSQSALVATIPPNAHVMLNVTPAALAMSATPPPSPSPLGTLNVVDNVAASAVPQVATLPPYPTPVLADLPTQTVRAVGDRTFVWRDSIWIDTTYDPDTMEPRKIVFLSEEYFALINQDARVAEFFALGDHVIFVLDGQAYEVVPEG